MGVDVEIEYCGTCGYGAKFEDLAKQIVDTFPDANVKGIIGRRATFEVSVNGTLIHSKLTNLAWPDPEDVLTVIEEARQGKEIRIVKTLPISSAYIYFGVVVVAVLFGLNLYYW